MTDLTPEKLAELREVATGWPVLAALMAERDRLAAAVERVRVLHCAEVVYLRTDECGHGDGDHDVIEADNGSGDLCGSTPTDDRYCGECTGEWDAELTDHPCATIRALDGAEDPT